MVKVVCRWLNKNKWFLLGDGAYACLRLASACIKNSVTLISRLRLDAQLYEFPEPAPVGKRGRKRIKGDRIHLKKLVDDESQPWETHEVKWYGEKTKTVKLLTNVCLWYQAGKTPVTIRYVLVVDPNDKHTPAVFFSTDADLSATKIIEYFVLRWNIEVTFEEARAHLGIETQRQWSDKSIARTTPLLMGLFSLVTLIALKLRSTYQLAPLSTAWYPKNDNATFSDIIAFVRRVIWANKYFSKSKNLSNSIKIDRFDLNLLINQLAESG